MTWEAAFDIGTWWVDECGRFHSGAGLDSSFDSTFVSHLGQVKIELQAGNLAITWDARAVDKTAMVAVLNRLSDHFVDTPVRLKFLYVGWVSETHDTSWDAVGRILEIQECCQIDIIHPTLMHEHDVAGISAGSTLIQQGFEFWRRTGGRMENADPDSVAGYLHHILIFRENLRGDDLVYSWVGSRSTCSRVYGRHWAEQALGTPASQSSGPETDSYAHRMNNVIHQVMETGVPRYHHVRALMNVGEDMPVWQSY